MNRHRIGRRYEDKMQHPLTRAFFEDSGFFNFGYWQADTKSAKAASENLLAAMLARLPDRRGPVLDVACGLGATTRTLRRHFGPDAVVGVNISAGQMAVARQNSPTAALCLADAVRLCFGGETFAAIVCVEAAFHFDGRADFLREAWRLLRPGGRLVLTDILFPRWAIRLNRRVPGKNRVDSLAEYDSLVRQAGFARVQVEDITRQSWGAFYRHGRAWRREKLAAGDIGPVAYAGMELRNRIANAGLSHYLLVSAEKGESYQLNNLGYGVVGARGRVPLPGDHKGRPYILRRYGESLTR